MEIKFEINKELEHKQLLTQKLEGNYNNENWCVIYLNIMIVIVVIIILIKIVVITVIIVKTIVMLIDNESNK